MRAWQSGLRERDAARFTRAHTQDTVLFNDTVFYNIAYGCPNVRTGPQRNAHLMIARRAGDT